MSLIDKTCLSLGVPSTPVLPAAQAATFARSTWTYAQLAQAKRQPCTAALMATITFTLNATYGATTYTGNLAYPFTWSVPLLDPSPCMDVANTGTVYFKTPDYSGDDPAPQNGVITASPGPGGGTFQIAPSFLNVAFLIARNPIAPWLSVQGSVLVNCYPHEPGVYCSCSINLFTGPAPSTPAGYDSVVGDAGTIFGVPVQYQSLNYSGPVDGSFVGTEQLSSSGVTFAINDA